MTRPPTRTPAAPRTLLSRLIGLALVATALPLAAAQIDIPGPAGSVAFGDSVTVLPNGNIVVTDPFAGPGAVHLYSPTGALISTLTGSAAGDQVGGTGIVVLSNGHFVVVSRFWDNGTVVNAGAVTWVNGATGLSGTISAANSLVGTSQDDLVGNAGSMGGNGVVALTNGHYVVASSNWSSGAGVGVGAVTWANGSSGRTGAVSSSNSLTGSNSSDFVGFDGVTPLPNGHYVVRSSLWSAPTSGAGAVTWGNGTQGITGEVSASNSLVGTNFNDLVGSSPIVVLENGHYVVSSPSWSSTTIFDAGAVTWANGTTGRTGAVNATNSLVGTTPSDRVGFPGVTALANGNYVVRSSEWDGLSAANVGAVTWASGVGGLVGEVGSGNSLVGTAAEDRVGDTYFVNNRARSGVVALSNGNYVVVSYQWDNGNAIDVGAVTWSDGAAGRSGVVNPANSLIGAIEGDIVGSAGVRALSNGHYVALSPAWRNAMGARVGAATWANGFAQTVGTVAASNSLVGSMQNDQVGANGLAVLPNGRYVVLSPFWDNGAATDAGAATWLDGAAGTSSVVTSSNSLVGSSDNDQVGSVPAIVLSNGHYVLASPGWNNSAVVDAGAVTWANGDSGLTGPVSTANSLVGTRASDRVGDDGVDGAGVVGFVDGNYAVASAFPDNDAIVDAGAATLARGDAGLVGTIASNNSVLGTATGGGVNLSIGYDAPRMQLAVGRPDSNLVSLFKLADAEVIFANGFE